MASRLNLIIFVIASVIGCAHAPTPDPSPLPPVVSTPVPAPAPPAPTPTAVKSETPLAQKVEPAPPPLPTVKREQHWNLKNGKLSGPGNLTSGKFLSKFVNPKSSAVTIDTCWNYGDFAVIESKTKGEIGAGEISVRHKGAGNLCAVEYKGKTLDLKIGEGYFAGVAGEYLLLDGADASDILRDFQIFAIESGKEVFKSQYHPAEEFSLHSKGGKTSLIYFAKLAVKCELALEEKVCWKKVLEQNQIKRAITMPDCTAAFKKTGTSSFDSALVTARAQVSDLTAAKVEFIGGRATCEPAP